MKPKNFADLQKYNLQNADDLKSLKGYIFTTNEALKLMRGLFESNSGIDEEQKNNYLQFILSINPTSKVEWHKFLPHMQQMFYAGNSSGLVAFCAFFLERGDKIDFLRHVPEFHKFLPVGDFFRILTINYRDDKKYYGKSSEEIICEMSDFLQHSKVAMPKVEEVYELIFQCDSLKTGAQALEFFSRRGFVEGFSLNLAIAFLTKIKIASTASSVRGSFSVEEAKDVVRSLRLLEELEIDENKLRELLQSFTDPEELEILRYLSYNKTSKALIQKLLALELANPESARKIKDPQAIFDFLRSSEFRLNAAQAKDCLSQIKERNPDAYAWSVYQLRHEIAGEFNGLGSNLSLQDLSQLNAIFEQDNEVLQSFIDKELAKFPLEKIIEFVLEDGDNFDINFGWMIMPRASEINIEHLDSIIEKCVSLPVKTHALQCFISLVKDSHFADAVEKKKFIKGLLGKMVEANKESGLRAEFRSRVFLIHNFKNIL